MITTTTTTTTKTTPSCADLQHNECNSGWLLELHSARCISLVSIADYASPCSATGDRQWLLMQTALEASGRLCDEDKMIKKFVIQSNWSPRCTRFQFVVVAAVADSKLREDVFMASRGD